MIMNGFFTKVLKLDDARSGECFNYAGSLFQVIDTSNPNRALKLKVNDRNNREFNAKRGFGWMQDKFTRLFISHDAAPGETVTIAIGGDPDHVNSSDFKIFTPNTSNEVQVTNTVGNPVIIKPNGWVNTSLANQAIDALRVKDQHQKNHIDLLRDGWKPVTGCSEAKTNTENEVCVLPTATDLLIENLYTGSDHTIPVVRLYGNSSGHLIKEWIGASHGASLQAHWQRFKASDGGYSNKGFKITVHSNYHRDYKVSCSATMYQLSK